MAAETLPEESKAVFRWHRTRIRSAIIASVQDIKGVASWDENDDTMLDYLDSYIENLIRAKRAIESRAGRVDRSASST